MVLVQSIWVALSKSCRVCLVLWSFVVIDDIVWRYVDLL